MCCCHKWLNCTTVLLFLAVGASSTEAQETADSLDQLRHLVQVGDHGTLMDVQGHEMQGTIAEISPLSLGLIVGETRVDFAGTDLETVSRRDSRWNSTLWGLAGGAAFGAWAEKGLAGEYGRGGVGYGSVVLPFAGLGAGIGFFTDAMVRGQHVIYARAPDFANNTLISPIWSSRRKGVSASLRF